MGRGAVRADGGHEGSQCIRGAWAGGAGYHLRALEAAGLIALVEQRQRRGCVERLLAARAQAFVIDPSVMGGRETSAIRAAAQDRFAADHLIDTAAGLLRDVARMQARAERQGMRLLTFTIDTEVSFATPADLERFTTAVAAFIAQEAAKLATPDAARRYRVVVGGHPAPQRAAVPKQAVPKQAVPKVAPKHMAPKPVGPKRPAPRMSVQKPPAQPSGESHERARSRPRRDSRRRPH